MFVLDVAAITVLSIDIIFNILKIGNAAVRRSRRIHIAPPGTRKSTPTGI